MQLAPAKPADRNGLPVQRGPGEIAVFRIARQHVTRIAVPQPRRALLGRTQLRRSLRPSATGCSRASISGVFASASTRSSVTASSISKGPTHVRRSVTTWPRQPSNAPEIPRDGAHVAARAADEAEHGMIGIGAGQKRQLVHVEIARGELHGLTGARDVIGAVSVHLDGGKLRRNLPDVADELRQRGGDPGLGRPVRRGFDNLAFGIVGGRLLAPSGR